MLPELLEQAKFRFLILNYDNLAAKSRYAQISVSPMIREMLMVICEEDCDAATGRTMLEERIRKMGLERRHPDYEFLRGKAHQSTFYDAVRWLEENRVIKTVPKRRTKGKGFQNAYHLEGNVLLFKNAEGGWIPSVLFVCPEKMVVSEGSDATEQSIIRLLPDESTCVFCGKKGTCIIHPSIREMVRLRNKMLRIPL